MINGTGFAQTMIAATLFKSFGWKETGEIAWGRDHAWRLEDSSYLLTDFTGKSDE